MHFFVSACRDVALNLLVCAAVCYVKHGKVFGENCASNSVLSYKSHPKMKIQSSSTPCGWNIRLSFAVYKTFIEPHSKTAL